MKKKRNLYIIAFLCFITLVGVTIAYLQSTDTFENLFNAGTYSVMTREVFTSPTNWKPGDTTPKNIITFNEGTIPVRVRVKLEESWTSHNNQPLELEKNGIKLALINFYSTDWVKDGEYYYYIREVPPRLGTEPLIQSITFNPEYQGDVTCSIIDNAKTCEASPNGYMQAKYTLNIITETVQADAYREVWNLSYDAPTENRIIYYDTNGQYDSYEDVTKRVFIRKTFLGDTLEKQEVGFIYNNNVHYLKGFISPNDYEYNNYQNENTGLLYERFDNKCISHPFDTECTLDDIRVTVDYRNSIEVIDSLFKKNCYIDYDGKAICHSIH